MKTVGELALFVAAVTVIVLAAIGIASLVWGPREVVVEVVREVEVMVEVPVPSTPQIITVEVDPTGECMVGGRVFEFWNNELGRDTFLGEMVICARGDKLVMSGSYGPSLQYWLDKGMTFEVRAPGPEPTPTPWVNKDPGEHTTRR